MHSYDLTGLSVLVVDDAELMRELLASVLRTLGVRRITTAEDAKKARAVLSRETPDLILLDIQLPQGEDGIALCRAIRRGETAAPPFVPVIIVSGYTDIHHIELARDAGANEFLAKPLSVKTLYGRFVALIRTPRGFVRNPVYCGPDRRRRTDRRHEADPPPERVERRHGRGRRDDDGSRQTGAGRCGPLPIAAAAAK